MNLLPKKTTNISKHVFLLVLAVQIPGKQQGITTQETNKNEDTEMLEINRQPIKECKSHLTAFINIIHIPSQS